MSTTRETARSVEEFAKIVSEAREHWHLEEVLPWFRGQGNAEWYLTPTGSKTERDTEDNVREEFITCAPTLSDVKPTSRWDWYLRVDQRLARARTGPSTARNST